MKATNYLGEQERRAVEAAIAAAETRTSAEIVCAVATESGRYDRAEAIVGLFCALLGLFVANLVGAALAAETGSWGSPVSAGFGWQALGVTLGFVGGNLAASYWHGLRRLVVARGEIEEETARAATLVFSRQRCASTRARGGLLIYLSLFERQVVVLADVGAHQALGERGIEALRDQAVERLRAGARGETFTLLIASAAEQLAVSLPHQPDDQDELPNQLQLYHPRP